MLVVIITPSYYGILTAVPVRVSVTYYGHSQAMFGSSIEFLLAVVYRVSC